MKKIIKSFVSLLTISLMICLLSNNVLANSAQTSWHGSDATGATIIEEDSPIIVTAEDLTFNIHEFPKNYYDDLVSFQAYDASVSAKYTFENPANYDVKARMFFPFGTLPLYAYDRFKSSYMLKDHFDNYLIKVNDKVINRQIRYSFMPDNNDFKLERDIAYLSDQYLDDDFYHPDLKVKEISFKVEGVDFEKHPAADAYLKFNADSHKTKLILERQTAFSSSDKMLGTFANQDNFRLYILGEDLDNYDWHLYHDGKRDEEIDAQVSIVQSQEYRFEDFLMKELQDDYSINKIDWYNAIVTMFKYYENDGVILNDGQLNLIYNLMAWYEYELDIKAHETITNEVIAPIYPSIDYSYEPTIYSYRYLLSPAKTYKDFKHLNIYINTDYELIDSSIKDFKKEGESYHYFSEELPEEELEFTLSTDINPKQESSVNIFTYILIIIALLLVLFTGIIVRKRK